MHPRHTRRSFLSAFLPLIFAHCASIESFETSSRNICQGDTVTITWQATGHVDLYSDPPTPDIGSKHSSGSQQFTLQQSTHFVLNARCLFSSDRSERDVAVVANIPREFGDPASCEFPEEGPTLRLALQEHQVSSRLRVVSVTNLNARDIVISKDNIRVTILPGQDSSAFDGLAALGAWDVKAVRKKDETCDNALAAIQDRLTFRLSFSCPE